MKSLRIPLQAHRTGLELVASAPQLQVLFGEVLLYACELFSFSEDLLISLPEPKKCNALFVGELVALT